jgi:D-threo-aldose 1-dehydrogenase
MIELKRTRIGDSGLELPEIGLGTASLGNFLEVVPEAQALATLQRALDVGLRYFDTAPLYGHGLSERRLGSALADVPRDDVVVSTKVGRLLREGAPRDESQYYRGEPFYVDVPKVAPVWDWSSGGIRTSLEESLARLELDRVDILQMHDPDAHYGEASTTAYSALRDLRSSGRVKAIGAGMNQTPVLTELVRACDLDVVLLAGRYTLLDQSSMSDLIPACRDQRTSIIVGGVFNSGILLNPSPSARFDYVPADSALIEKARQLQSVCEAHGVPLAAAAIQFPLAHPQIASVLIGARSVDELDMDLELLRVEIPGQLWRDLKRRGLLPEEVPTPDEN